MGSRPTPADIATYNARAQRNGEDAWGVRRGSPDGPKQQILEELRALADSRNIRDARKLYQTAKAQEMRGVTQALAQKSSACWWLARSWLLLLGQQATSLAPGQARTFKLIS